MKLKKSNVEILKSYLAGDRPFVMVGYTPPKSKRNKEETWVDNKGIKWVQKNGYKARVNEQANMIRGASKRKCVCGQDIQYGSKLDEKFFAKTGKCFDCVIKEETELRVLGVFTHYENYKVLSNYLAFLKEVEQKIKDSIKYFETEGDTLEVLCNSEGFLEKFKGMNTEGLLKEAKKDLDEINKSIEKVTADKEQAKRDYEEELKKAHARLLEK